DGTPVGRAELLPLFLAVGRNLQDFLGVPRGLPCFPDLLEIRHRRRVCTQVDSRRLAARDRGQQSGEIKDFGSRHSNSGPRDLGQTTNRRGELAVVEADERDLPDSLGRRPWYQKYRSKPERTRIKMAPRLSSHAPWRPQFLGAIDTDLG